jgi:hypothetical protein
MKRCIRITGTKTGKLRARVETTVSRHVALGYYVNENKHFEVTIGGQKWTNLPQDLKDDILQRAERYVGHLMRQLKKAL